MTTDEAAALFGVKRTTLNKWRQRYSDFPRGHRSREDEPITYDRSELEAWGLSSGRWDVVGIPIRKWGSTRKETR